MDEKYAAFFAKIAPRQPLLIRHFSLFSRSPREGRFTGEILYATKSATLVHAVGGIIEIWSVKHFRSHSVAVFCAGETPARRSLRIGGTGRRRRTENVLDRQNIIAN